MKPAVLLMPTLTGIRLSPILFLTSLLLITGCAKSEGPSEVQTVLGSLNSDNMGKTLIHEHVLVDFIGADSTGTHRWNRDEVANVVLPYLAEVKKHGFETIIECTPSYLGRDPELLKILSQKSGLNILTNSGYYGARNNKFLPAHALTESAEALAQRWIVEWKNGIDETGIRPGFIKIGVDSDSILSETHQKLIRAAALAHRETGLTIASHTNLATPAFSQMEILREEGVSPEAFIWVHAQSEKDLTKHIKAASLGAWISLDNVNEGQIDEYVQMIMNLKEHGLLHRVLISHDAGWYSPGENQGGDFRGYTDIPSALLPALKTRGFSDREIDQVLVKNPAKAFQISVRSFKNQ